MKLNDSRQGGSVSERKDLVSKPFGAKGQPFNVSMKSIPQAATKREKRKEGIFLLR